MTQTDDDDTEGENRHRIIKAHAAQLAEHFDTVQIFCMKHLGDDCGTENQQFGVGIWHARIGQVKEWVVKQDEISRIEVRRQADE